MKKTLLNIIKFIILIVIVIVIDFLQAYLFKNKPIFSVENIIDNGIVYKSVFIDVYVCIDSSNEEKIFIEKKGSKISCPLVKKLDFEIIDEQTMCDNELEKFYEDKYFEYYFKCKKSDVVFIEFKEGTKMTVKKALIEELVTINELESAGLDFYKEAIN